MVRMVRPLRRKMFLKIMVLPAGGDDYHYAPRF
jgi:hypothetical protein